MSNSTSQHFKTQYSIMLIGCGKMGSAMLNAWLSQDLVSSAHVIDPTPLPRSLSEDKRITSNATFNTSNPIKQDILVLAVKPQILKEAAEKNANKITPNTVILSIAAGQSLATLSSIFGDNQPIVRAMPNTPASIGKGMSVSIANQFVTEVQKTCASTLLLATGLSHWIEDESLMDAVTALSGSGPAYVFHLIEALAKSGENIGLPPDMAMILARQTVIGSAALAEHENETTAQTLRENVTSPNGTTAAALNVLMDGRFQDVLDEALHAAKKRSEELNQ